MKQGLQNQLSPLNLLIIDELGFVPLSPTGANCSSRSSDSATSATPCPGPLPGAAGWSGCIRKAMPYRTYTFMKQLPQRGSFPQIGVFHTHRLYNGWLCEVQVDNYTKLMP